MADRSFSPDHALGAGYCFWCIEKPLSPPQSNYNYNYYDVDMHANVKHEGIEATVSIK